MLQEIAVGTVAEFLPNLNLGVAASGFRDWFNLDHTVEHDVFDVELLPSELQTCSSYTTYTYSKSGVHAMTWLSLA